MIEITDGEWLVDLSTKKCRNVLNGVVVVFQKRGKFYEGKVEHIPDGLMTEWATGIDGARKIEKAVMEAEEVFMRAFFQSDIEKNGIRDEWLS